MTNSSMEKAKNSAELGSSVSSQNRSRSSEAAAYSSAKRAALVTVPLLLAGGLAVMWWVARPQGILGTGSASTATAPSAVLAEIPEVHFTDITKSAGINFVHDNGAYGEKLLPETTGGGCAFFDYDNDGDQDILFVNSCDWPWKSIVEDPPGALVLYRNEGTGHFKEVTESSGLQATLYGMGVAVGDYDNDGWVDVFVTTVGLNRLFKNLGGGRFSEVTAQAGVGGAADEWSTSCAWIDYDRDGDLDLFVCNYVQWSRQIDLEVNYQLPGLGRAYGPPMNFVGTFPYLYRNDGQGRFTDVSGTSGIQIKKPGTNLPMAKSLGVAPVDFDGDGWIDLIVANDTVQNFAFQNQRNGTFKEVAALKGLAYSSFGGVRGAMGIDSSRFQDDDNLAVAIGNFANEMTALYVTQNDPFVFTDDAIGQGIGHASRNALTFGVFFLDYDLDGWLDLLTANGHIEPDIARIRPDQQYKQSAQLFWNARGSSQGGGFVPVPPEKCGSDLFTPVAGRGSAYADIDGDGDLDVLITQIAGPPLLLRNDQAMGRHYLRLKLIGKRSNRDAIGAWVRVRVGNKTLSRQVMPTRGFLSQSELPVTVGLGSSTGASDVTITWPDGATQQLGALPADRLTVIEQAH